MTPEQIHQLVDHLNKSLPQNTYYIGEDENQGYPIIYLENPEGEEDEPLVDIEATCTVYMGCDEDRGWNFGIPSDESDFLIKEWMEENNISHILF